MADGEFIDIEVAYAEPGDQRVVALRVCAGTSAGEAVRKSGLAERFPNIDVNKLSVGVFGVRVAPCAPLAHGDRVEIYRLLQVEPKQARRDRAARSRERQKS